MKRGIVLAAIGVLLAFGAASAYPSKVRTVHIRTTITHDGSVDLGAGRFLLSGLVDVRSRSLREVCQPFRSVALKVRYPDGTWKLADWDETSGEGAWAAKVDLTGADRVKVKALRSEAVSSQAAPRRHHSHRRAHSTRVICRPAVVVWRVA